jgi:colicin import membrane protein
MPKLKVELAETKQELERVSTLYTDMTAQHASLQAKHASVETSANSFKQDAEKHKEESANLKLSLAQQEDKFQALQTSHENELKQLKQELEEAQLAAQEAAEAAESAAATATAAAAAAAAMAGGDSDDEYMMDDKMGDAMADAEASREVDAAEAKGQKEMMDSLRKQLDEEMSKRKEIEAKLKRLEDQQGLSSISSQLRSAEEAAHKSSSE